jgi:hypothetical protein
LNVYIGYPSNYLAKAPTITSFLLKDGSYAIWNYFVANPSFLSLLVLILSTIHLLQALIRLYAVVEAEKVIVPAIVQARIFERQRSSGYARGNSARGMDLPMFRGSSYPYRAIHLLRLDDGGADGT